MNRLFISMAFKNLTRHRRRTIITAVALAIGVSMYIGLESIMGGFTGEADIKMQDYEFGSAAFFAQDYWEVRDEYPLDMLIENPRALLQELDAADIPAAPRTPFRGELVIHYDPFPEDGSIATAFTAIDPQRDPAVFDLHEDIYAGRFLEGGEELIIGRWLAEQLGAEVGYTVSVETRTRDGFRQLLDLEIVGLYETYNPQVDRNTVYVPLDLANEYLEMRGAVIGIYTRLPESIPGTADLTPLRDILASAGNAATSDNTSLELLSFRDMTTELTEVAEMSDAYTGIVMLLLAIIAIVGISNTMLMSVLERQQEIGMLRSMGFRPREIRRVFMLEAAGIGLIGAAGGIILGIVYVWLLTSFGIDYSAFMQDIDMSMYRFEGVLYGVWDPASMAAVAVFAVVVTGLAGLLPTRRILRKSITACLRQSK